MYRILLSAVLLLSSLQVSAKEGMWPPFLLQYIADDLHDAGLQLEVSELYDKQPSLKDAVVIFGGGCTGEFISSQGLVLTNHHCGYGTVQGLSSVDNNYMLDGFFAKQKSEEIPCPGLMVRLVDSYEDVTDSVLNFDTDNYDPTQADSIIKANIKTIESKWKGDSVIQAKVANFYQGNQYFLILYKMYTDVRLVAFPPNGIGKFGGDTDNWAWPRHTGDFGLFRVYADTENQPAAYSENNVAYKPAKHFTLNVDGAKPGAFSMVYGFPGRTSEYISSAEVRVIKDVIDPSRIDCRQAKLDVWNEAMAQSEEVFVKYASKQARVANYWKKWKGEVLGLETNDVLSIKQEREEALMNRLNMSQTKTPELDSLYSLMPQSEELLRAYYYYIEALKGMELYQVSATLQNLITHRGQPEFDSLMTKAAKSLEDFYKNYDIKLDKKATIALYQLYQKNVAKSWQLPKLANTSNLQSKLEQDFDRTELRSLSTAKKMLQTLKDSSSSALADDPIYQWSQAITTYYDSTLRPPIQDYVSKRNRWNKELMSHYFSASTPEKPIFPDANSTLRLAYGKVGGVQAEDGVEYSHTTTLEGVRAKYNPNLEEFNAPQRLLDIIRRRDYGRYAVEGKVPVCFLASNHTTGGNSGSPVLDAKGQLIGLNFDRIWQGTMSDLYFDESICRNISVNIRYVLFLLDKYGEAGWLIDEMDIVGAGF